MVKTSLRKLKKHYDLHGAGRCGCNAIAEDDHSRKLICFGLASEMRKNSVMLDHLKD